MNGTKREILAAETARINSFAQQNTRDWNALCSAEPTGWSAAELARQLQLLQDNALYPLLPVYLTLKSNNYHMSRALAGTNASVLSSLGTERELQAFINRLREALLLADASSSLANKP